jgi:hypothetical protein
MEIFDKIARRGFLKLGTLGIGANSTELFNLTFEFDLA